MKFTGKAFLASGAAATLAVSPMPLLAANFTPQSQAATSADILQQTSNWHDRGWGRHDRIDAGDVLTGIGILAGIAIIAGAATKSDRHDRDRQEPRYDDRRDDRPVYQGNDIGTAVGACSDAAERSAGNGARVREIQSATRDGDGWRVEGNLDGDAARTFDCAATNGRVDYVRLDGRQN